MDNKTLVIIVIFLFVLIKGFFIEPNSLETVRYEIADRDLRGIRIAFLTDFHLKKGEYDRVDKIVDLTNELDVDAVLIGGDFVKSRNLKNSMQPEMIAQKLSLLHAPTYSVLGEYDWQSNGEAIKKALQSNGIKVLDNSSIRVILRRKYVDIIGLADYSTRTIDLLSAFKRTTNPRIVITHNPDVYYDILDDVNLILAGHTHGGQFVLPLLRAVVVSSKYGSDFAFGMIEKTRNKMIISKGLGVTRLPIRFNCKPEITIVDFI